MTLKIEKQRVDIILPNFNSHEYLESTLKSIISQNYKYWRGSIYNSHVSNSSGLAS